MPLTPAQPVLDYSNINVRKMSQYVIRGYLVRAVKCNAPFQDKRLP